MTDTKIETLIAEAKKWIRLHEKNCYQGEAARRMGILADAMEQVAAERDATRQRLEDLMAEHRKAGAAWDRVRDRLTAERDAERSHIQSLAKWVGVSEETPSLEIACEVSTALEQVTAQRDAALAAIREAKAWHDPAYEDEFGRHDYARGYKMALRSVRRILSRALDGQEKR